MTRRRLPYLTAISDFHHRRVHLMLAIGALACSTRDGEERPANIESTVPPPVEATPYAGAAPELPGPDLRPLSDGVIIELSIDTTAPMRPKLVGQTNLPDGAI